MTLKIDKGQSTYQIFVLSDKETADRIAENEHAFRLDLFMARPLFHFMKTLRI